MILEAGNQVNHINPINHGSDKKNGVLLVYEKDVSFIACITDGCHTYLAHQF